MRIAGYRPTAFWSLGFRPFFLAASVWSALAVVLWVAVFLRGGTLPTRFDPLTWHIHAMLFGFVPAVAAGFLLTAIPNWTGRRPIQGSPLVGLLSLWLLGRAACLVSAYLPLWLAATFDLVFPTALCVCAGYQIVRARNWRNLMMPLPIGLLAIADLLVFLELAGANVPAGLGWRLAIAAILSLVSAIGGRIIPAFTRNWLLQRGLLSIPTEHGQLDRAALSILHTALLGWAVFPGSIAVGALLILAALVNLVRLSRWRGMATLPEPLLAVLHLAYAWIVLGTGWLGLSQLFPLIPAGAALHALTVGAIGTMVLAVMTRVSRGHTGRPLTADGPTKVIYLLITLAAVARVLAACLGDLAVDLIVLSAVLWVASFGLFVLFYGPILVTARVNMAPS